MGEMTLADTTLPGVLEVLAITDGLSIEAWNRLDDEHHTAFLECEVETPRETVLALAARLSLSKGEGEGELVAALKGLIPWAASYPFVGEPKAGDQRRALNRAHAAIAAAEAPPPPSGEGVPGLGPRLGRYPDFLEDQDGLDRWRETAAIGNGHDMASANKNTIQRFVQTIDRLKLALAATPTPSAQPEAFTVGHGCEMIRTCMDHKWCVGHCFMAPAQDVGAEWPEREADVAWLNNPFIWQENWHLRARRILSHLSHFSISPEVRAAKERLLDALHHADRYESIGVMVKSADLSAILSELRAMKEKGA